MGDTRYIKVKATIKSSNVTITEDLEVKEFEYDIDVFERWKSRLLVDCGFETIHRELGDE